MASQARIAIFAVAVLFLNCSTAQQNVQRCAAFLRQLPSFNCNCNGDMKTCSCLVDSQRRTSDVCRLAFALSNSNTSSSGSVNVANRQREPFPPPNGIDLRPRNAMLGTLTGLEEPIFHLRRLPSDLRELNTRFILYNDRAPEVGLELNYNDVGSIVRVSSQRLFHRLFVIAHDFNEGQIESNPNYVELKNRLLAFIRPSAVLFVDWQIGAQGNVLGLSFHSQAAVNTIVVGREVALICYLLHAQLIVDETDVHLIGNGLGAQMLHFAAKYYTQLWKDFVPNGDNPAGRDGPQHKLGRFTALDPTAKDFQGYLNNNLVVSHVNRWDATFVDVIHTSSVKDNANFRDSFRGRFGMSIPCGKFDFYPNGGVEQPNCKSFLNLRSRLPLFTNCHHEMALHYFIGSITTNVNISNAFTAFGLLSWADDQLFQEEWRDRPVNFMGIDAQDNQELERLYSMPIYMDVPNYSINGPETEKITYNEGDIRLEAPRIVHPNFVQPNLTSGQIIRDFPQQKPAQLTALDPLERPSCGQFRTPPADGGTEGRVVQGHFSFANQFPWTFCMLSYAVGPISNRLEWGRACSGVILDRNWLLTAAHCFRVNMNPPNEEEFFENYPDGWVFYISFGTTDCLKPQGTNYRRFVHVLDTTVFFPPEWDPDDRYLRWDVALMRLVKPIKLPEPYDGGPINSICWRTAPKFDFSNRETDLHFAGYGLKNVALQFSNEKLTWMTLRTVQPDFTSFVGGEFLNEQLEVSEGLFVTLRPTLRGFLQKVCKGDSGGGYVWYIQPQNARASTVVGVSPFRGVVVAVESQGVTCDNPEVGEDGSVAYPELVTGVASDVFDWMVQTISDNRQAGNAIGAADEDPVTRDWPRLFEKA